MCCLGSRSEALFVRLYSGDEEDMSELFRAEEPSGLNKRELYKQNKEAQMMERLERRMEGKPQVPPDDVLTCIQRLFCHWQHHLCERRVGPLQIQCPHTFFS